MFGEIDSKIRDLLGQRLDRNLISVEDLLVITLKLGEATDEASLREKAKELIEKYPFLKDAFLSEEHEDRRNLQDIVQGFIPEFIKIDPIKAAKLGERAMDKEITLEQLFEEFPEFKQHYENKYQK